MSGARMVQEGYTRVGLSPPLEAGLLGDSRLPLMDPISAMGDAECELANS